MTAPRFQILLLFVAFATALSACKSPGTDTGNPQFGSPAPVPVASMGPFGALSAKVCEQVARCYPTSAAVSVCGEVAYEDAGMAQELGGLPEFASPQALDEAAGANSINVSTGNLTTCMSRLAAVSCSDSLMVNAYQETHAGSYSDVSVLLRVDASCAGIVRK